MPQDLLGFADAMATEYKTTRSKVISDSLREMRRREQDDLAREGYRFYADEAEEFAEMSRLRPPSGEDELRPIGQLGVTKLAAVDQALKYNLGLA